MKASRTRAKSDPSFWLSLVFVIVIALGVLTAARWRWDTRLFPWAIGLPALGLAVWQLISDFMGSEEKSPGEETARGGIIDIPVDPSIPEELRRKRTVRALTWVLAFTLGIWLLGFMIAIPLFVFAYLIYEAEANIVTATLITALMFLFIWVVFDLMMHLAWPEAVLFGLLF